MEQTTFNRIKIEMQSFKGLIITNLIGAAFALAFSMAYGVPNIIPLLTEGLIQVDQLPHLGVIIIGFVVGINWIIKSAELMGEHEDILNELEDLTPRDDEAVTSVIVQYLAFYRENRTKIRQLGIVSRIVGGFLLIASVLQLQALLTGVFQLEGWMIYAQPFGVLASLGVGIAGLYLPTLLNKFAAKWDIRLSSAEAAEERLDRILQG